MTSHRTPGRVVLKTAARTSGSTTDPPPLPLPLALSCQGEGTGPFTRCEKIVYAARMPRLPVRDEERRKNAASTRLSYNGVVSKRLALGAAAFLLTGIVTVGLYGWQVAHVPPEPRPYAFLHGAKGVVINPDRHGWSPRRSFNYAWRGSSIRAARQAKAELLPLGWVFSREYCFEVQGTASASFRHPNGEFLTVVDGESAVFAGIITHPLVRDTQPEQRKAYVCVTHWIKESETVYWWRDFWDGAFRFGPSCLVLALALLPYLCGFLNNSRPKRTRAAAEMDQIAG